MTFTVSTHLNFQGQAKSVLDFYKEVFEGEQTLMSYGAMGQAEVASSPDDIIWGQVKSPDGFHIMAFDVQAGRPYDAGRSAFYVSLRGTSAETVQKRWSALALDATILHPLGPSAWSALYGMLTDRFGITWVIDIEPEPH
jgi:PhnB protein